jgi:hypothetical protein
MPSFWPSTTPMRRFPGACACSWHSTVGAALRRPASPLPCTAPPCPAHGGCRAPSCNRTTAHLCCTCPACAPALPPAAEWPEALLQHQHAAVLAAPDAAADALGCAPVLMQVRRRCSRGACSHALAPGVCTHTGTVACAAAAAPVAGPGSGAEACLPGWLAGAEGAHGPGDGQGGGPAAAQDDGAGGVQGGHHAARRGGGSGAGGRTGE